MEALAWSIVITTLVLVAYLVVLVVEFLFGIIRWNWLRKSIIDASWRASFPQVSMIKGIIWRVLIIYVTIATVVYTILERVLS